MAPSTLLYFWFGGDPGDLYQEITLEPAVLHRHSLERRSAALENKVKCHCLSG
jgi:hypothetical protein